MNPTGSSVERAVQCPGSFAMNQARSTGEAAVKGTENHEGIEGDLIAGTESKHRVVREVIAGATELRVEVAYALDVETGKVRYLGERLGRDYGPLGDAEIALTLDLVRIGPSGVGIYDWKSRKRVTRAAKNWQLKVGAVCVMKHLGASQVAAGIGYLDNDELDAATFDAFDIPGIMMDLRKMLNRIGAARTLVASGGTPEVHEGSWCDYCPAMAYCPAKTRIALAMLSELRLVNEQIAFMTPDQVGKAWVKLQQIQTLAENVEAALKLRARQDVVPLPNGKRLALIEMSRMSDDTKAMKARLRELGEDPDRFKRKSEFSQVREINMPGKTGTDGE